MIERPPSSRRRLRAIAAEQPFRPASDFVRVIIGVALILGVLALAGKIMDDFHNEPNIVCGMLMFILISISSVMDFIERK